ncbi:MAG: hypothetical protein QM718_12035 [Steroidobacteraceae bacterium]
MHGADNNHIKCGLLALLFTAAASAADSTAVLGDLQGLRLADGTAPASSFSYAARDDFSQPSLSPGGTRVAMITRRADNVSTLVVLDTSGEKVQPIMQLDVPRMLSIQNYGWVNEDRLVAWINIDNTYSSDDDPTTSLYIAQLDLKTKKVSERPQPNTLSSDLVSAFPVSSDLVRAPWRADNHVLISECSRVNGFKTISRAATAGYTFPEDPPASSQINCKLLDWDLIKNRASAIGWPLAAYPSQMYASGSSIKAAAEGRKLGGKLVDAKLDATVSKKWKQTPFADTGLMMAERDSSEEDFPELWKSIHKVLPEATEPVGEVVKTSATQTPVGLQFERPDRSFVALSADLRAPAQMLENTFKDATVSWLGVSENHDTVLFSVQSVTDPGTYYLWRRARNEALRLTGVRAISGWKPLPTTLESGWTDSDVPVAITRPQSKTLQGLVIMPVVVSDEAAAAELGRFNTLVQWFAAHGLAVAQVPVGVPGVLPEAQRGDVWRKAVADRILQVNVRARTRLHVAINDRVCLYGDGTAGYAALAANAYGSQIGCVIAWNVRLDPATFVKPYAQITGLSQSSYFNLSNPELLAWRGVYGSDLAAAAPAKWTYANGSEVMLGYTMYDKNRVLSGQTGSLRRRIGSGGGDSSLYSAVVNTQKPDLWLAGSYDAMLQFVLPPQKAGKQAKIYVEDVVPQQ